MRSREQCAIYNGHSAPKLEKAILEYLGKFSDPQLVREYLAASDQKELEHRQTELHDVEKHLADYEAQFLTRLNDLMKRNVLTEEEFARANQAARAEAATLEARKTELKAWVEKEQARTSLAEALPKSVQSFVDAFGSMDIRQQKAQLQTILKAARVYRDGPIELEFRQ